jgi:hypothetical protein
MPAYPFEGKNPLHSIRLKTLYYGRLFLRKISERS